MVQLEGVWKTYDTVKAVRNVSLDVTEGQTLGLIGPNGSGKTTLLRMITTLAKPDRGSIHVKGVDAIREPRDVRRCLAFMPAEFGFPNQMNIGEYMDYFACLAGIPYRQRPKTINQVLELTDLLGRESESVRGLSTGNRQRLLLAKTLLGDPKLLVLDEPASGLDPRARAEVREILKVLASMGKTILISSHILADIQNICTHICILEAGKMLVHDSLKNLLEGEARTERIVRLTIPAEQAVRAKELVAVLDGVIDCELKDDLLEIKSAKKNCNYILRCLIEGDVEICNMAEDRPNLEEIFIRETEGRVT